MKDSVNCNHFNDCFKTMHTRRNNYIENYREWRSDSGSDERVVLAQLLFAVLVGVVETKNLADAACLTL